MIIKSFLTNFEFPDCCCRTPCAYVINTDASDEPGEHWVAILINNNGTGEYFDPFGLPPLHEDFWRFLGSNCPNGWIHSTTPVQGIQSTMCGAFCVLYIKARCKGISYLHILQLFTRNFIINHQIIKNTFTL